MARGQGVRPWEVLQQVCKTLRPVVNHPLLLAWVPLGVTHRA